MTMRTELFPDVERRAKLSEDGVYRYRLSRVWDPHLGRMAFIMLNPSTADAYQDDPTIRRCMGFARREGCGGIEVINLYAFRATDPKQLAEACDPEGPDNPLHWAAVLEDHAIDYAVAAWGAWRPKVAGEVLRSKALDEWFTGGWFSLGVTANGSPRHPLYVRGDQELTPWRRGGGDA